MMGLEDFEKAIASGFGARKVGELDRLWKDAIKAVGKLHDKAESLSKETDGDVSGSFGSVAEWARGAEKELGYAYAPMTYLRAHT